MKKIICALLSITAIAISFTGCMDNTAIKEPASNSVEEVKNPLEEIDLSKLGAISLIDYTNDDDMIAILYTPFVSEEEIDFENYDFKTYLTLYDMNKKSLKSSVEVDPDSFEADFLDDNIQIWNSDDNYVLYDLSLNEIGSSEGKLVDGYAIAENIDTIDTSRFSCRESYADDSNYINYDVMIFYNDKDNYYISKRNKLTNEISSCDKIIFDYTQSNDEKATFSVKNYENLTLTNSITISGENGYFCVADGIINSEYAIFETLKENGSMDKLYCWSYNDNAVNTPLECEVINDNDFDNYVNTVCERIRNNYGVNVEISKSLDGDEFFYKGIDNKTNAKYLLCLYDLEYCFSTFPKQMYDEMLCNDIDDAVAEFEKFNIYMVGEIDDSNVDAFADNANGELRIVYSCNAFTYSTFCHELMHTMEYRIWNYEPDFDEKWEMLNPDDFYYTEDYGEAYYENESYANYFARDYGIKGLLEDRATVFEMYYDAQRYEGDAWWQEHKPLNDKVNYLNEVLSKSYPSLKDFKMLKNA